MKRIVCFGDSNTYGYDPRSPLGDRYPPEVRWTDALARGTGWAVQNAGQNGRCIPRRPAELALLDRLLDPSDPPDLLTVMLGSNDLLQTPGLAARDAAARMEPFLKRLTAHPGAGEILLLAPPPMKRGQWVTEQRLLTESAALADEYGALARRLGVLFADAGQWGVELAFDGVHFSEDGHRAFAAGLQRELDAIFAFEIRDVPRRSPELIRQLTAVWEASVRATHAFLTEEDLRAIAPSVPPALAAVPHLAAAYQDGVPVGFLGAAGERLEMLFLAPTVRGRGLGRRLMAWGLRQYGFCEVCVNEQNPQARGFYAHLGFRVCRRTDRDEQDRPFPLLYLRREIPS